LCSSGFKVESLSLEQRLTKLEKEVAQLEDSLVTDYGLIRRCRLPQIEHGKASCNFKDLKPYTLCKVICNPGWIPTPGKQFAWCQEGGEWNTVLKCELPVLVVAGGVDKSMDEDVRNSVEVISVLPGEGCDNLRIPDMLSGNGLRSLHNLAYSPGGNLGKTELLVCNSISEAGNPTCDSWSPGMEAWLPNHSSPHMEDSIRELLKLSFSKSDRKKMGGDESSCGRYASSSLTISGRVVIAGGMVQCDRKHEVVESIKTLKKDTHGRKEMYWSHLRDMKEKRSFFCAVDLMDSNVMAMGGYSENKTILKSAEHFAVSSNWTEKFGKSSWSNWKLEHMIEARSGHGCTLLDSEREFVLVSGGSNVENGEAMKSSELYNIALDAWSYTHNMNEPRFGHAVVKMGDQVLAVGGSRMRPDVMTNTIEIYDRVRGWSFSPSKLRLPRANFGYALVPHSFFPGCTLRSE